MSVAAPTQKCFLSESTSRHYSDVWEQGSRINQETRRWALSCHKFGERAKYSDTEAEQ